MASEQLINGVGEEFPFDLNEPALEEDEYQSAGTVMKIFISSTLMSHHWKWKKINRNINNHQYLSHKLITSTIGSDSAVKGELRY